MGYTYRALVFNDEAKRKADNINRVRYDSYSTESWGSGVWGRDVTQRYSLLGTDERGRKVSFYVSKKVLDQLEQGKAYAFRLSENLGHGYYHQEPGESGLCTTAPKSIRFKHTSK